jgi:hypothetical protein
VTRYILENPVRANLAHTVQEWPHSGSGVWAREAVIDWAYSESDADWKPKRSG